MISDPKVAFDQNLETGISLTDLWEQAQQYSDASRLKDKRYWKTGNLVLRSHLACDFWENDIDSIANVPENIDFHLNKLQQLGMCVVSNSFELADNLQKDEEALEIPDAIVAYSATTYIKGAYRVNSPKSKRELREAKIDEFIVSPLLQYLLWCRAEETNFILDDIYRPSQYSWQASSGVVFLHDIDPSFSKMSAGKSISYLSTLSKTFQGL